MRAGAVVWLVWWGLRGVVSESAEAETTAGTVSGVTEVSRNSTKYFAFRSIPYAKPPTGTRRFAKPEPPEPWDEVIDVSADAPVCIQTSIFLPRPFFDFEGQEDCLYLSVFTPTLDKESKLPVFVFIHGGGNYMWTGAKMFGPEYLMDEPIVLVMMNYRLGPFGFLSVGEEWLTSNLGLWDQLEALRWVNTNILNFGGDPDRVTVGGQSVGAVSTHFFLQSSLTKSMIKQGIMFSGSSSSPWAVTAPEVARERGLKALSLLGCPQQPSSEALACLRNASLEDIVRLQAKYFEWDTNPLILFGTTLDSSDDGILYFDELSVPSNAPVMVGLTRDEGIFCVPGLMLSGDTRFKELDSNFTDLASIAFLWLPERGQQPEVSQQIKEFYFGQDPITPGPNITNLFSDSWFISGVDAAVEKHQGDVYRFKVVDRPSVALVDILKAPYPPGDYGPGHTDDMLYLFNLSRVYPQQVLTTEEVALSELMVKAFTRFIITGEPGEDGSWPASKVTQMSFSKAGASLEPVGLEDRRAFWASLRPLLYPDKPI